MRGGSRIGLFIQWNHVMHKFTIIVRQLSDHRGLLTARVYQNGEPIMFDKDYPFQGLGKTPGEAIGYLVNCYSNRLGLTYECAQTVGNTEKEILDLGRSVLSSAVGTRNFLIQSQPEKIW